MEISNRQTKTHFIGNIVHHEYILEFQGKLMIILIQVDSKPEIVPWIPMRMAQYMEEAYKSKDEGLQRIVNSSRIKPLLFELYQCTNRIKLEDALIQEKNAKRVNRIELYIKLLFELKIKPTQVVSINVMYNV